MIKGLNVKVEFSVRGLKDRHIVAVPLDHRRGKLLLSDPR